MDSQYIMVTQLVVSHNNLFNHFFFLSFFLFLPGPGAQYQQEMIYTTGPDGTPGEPLMAYVPYNPAHGQQMAGPPYWPPGVPQDQAGAVYVAGPGGQAIDGAGMVRRVVYNPVNPQYANIPLMTNGGPVGGRGTYAMTPTPAGMMAVRQPGEMDMGMYGNPRDNRAMDRGKDSRRSMLDNRDDKRYDRERGNTRNHSRDMNGYGRASSSVNPMRDPLVDEFRSTYGKSRQWELVDLLGHVVAFCQDQHGSRFIQQRLEVCAEVDKQLIFDEIIPSAHSLMTDVFGNYVLQKLFEYGTPEQCETLALLLAGQSVQLSMQMYGCRVVQKALEYVSTQRLIVLVSEFENPQVCINTQSLLG